MLKTSLNQLELLLNIKIKLYQGLRNILIEEKNVIGKGNISLFQKFLLKKELILKKLRDLEENRKTILIKIALEMDISFDDISLSKIIKNTNGSTGAKLAQSRKQLIELVNAIDKQLTYNEKLVSKSSKSNNRVLGFFNRFNKNFSYASDGKIGHSVHKSWMLNAEV
ncbi:MAG TPA: flagellar export chaperone FlgN [Nitrospinota bacterium]|nr:flagellar export chaperone FlgN [Nitrospinota bacterium]